MWNSSLHCVIAVVCSMPSQELVGIKPTSLTVTSVSDLTMIYVTKERKCMAQYCLMFRDLQQCWKRPGELCGL